MRKSQSVVMFYFVSFLLFLGVTSAFAGTKNKPRDQSTADSDFRRAYAGQKINILMSAGLQTSPVVALKGWFEELTGIQASIEVYDETTTREKAVLDFTSRTGNYDALMTQDYFFDEFQAAGWFEPLDDYVKNHADPKWLNLNDLPKTSTSYFTKDGKLYALPFTLLGGVLFYNEEVFKRNNLKPPETIENM
jgi:multiple sugar transport system substrate-binding protein